MYNTWTVPRKLQWNTELCRLLTRELPIELALLRGNYTFSLFTVRKAVTDYIRINFLYDKANSAIVLSDEKLEAALGVKTFLLSNLDYILMRKMKVEANFHHFMAVDLTNENYVCSNTNYSTNGLFWVKPHLRKVLSTVQKIKSGKTAFTYQSICSLVSEYIMKNKDTLLDPNNVAICRCENTDLALAFRVKAFHRSQLHELIKSQIRPLTSFYIRSRRQRT